MCRRVLFRHDPLIKGALSLPAANSSAGTPSSGAGFVVFGLVYGRMVVEDE